MNPFLITLCLGLCAPPAAGSGPAAPTWEGLRQILLQLKSETGSAALLKDNPQLDFPQGTTISSTPASYWRDRVIPLPASPEDLDPELATVEIKRPSPDTVVYFTFHNTAPKGSLTYLKLTWEGEQMTKIQFFRGFTRTVPAVERTWEDSYAYTYVRRPASKWGVSPNP